LDKNDLERRTRVFALRVVSFISALPGGRIGDILGRQLLRSGTSVGANYREANRAGSRKDFLHRINVVEREAAETLYWLELLDETDLGQPDDLAWLKKESDELVAIFTRIGRTTRANPKSALRNPKSRINPKSEIRNSKSPTS